MTVTQPKAVSKHQPVWFLLGLGGLLAARMALLWPGGRRWFWAYAAFTLLLNFLMLRVVKPDFARYHLRLLPWRSLLWLLPVALGTRLLLNPSWPVEALGLPMGVLIAGGCEEPLFRGYLWGFLKQNRWPEGLILVVQALLFGLAHSYYFFQYADPWIWQRTFVAGLALGLVAWKSRSVVASALVHGILNM